MSKREQALVWKVASLAVGAGAGFVADKMLRAAWQQATHDEPPGDPADRNVSWGPALLWAAATGIGFGLARLLAQRAAAGAWEAATNEPPPGVAKSD